MRPERLAELREALNSARGRVTARPPVLTFEDIEALVSTAEREAAR